MPPLNSKEIYYLDRTRGLSIIDVHNNIIGFHSGYAAIAHNGTSIGKVRIIDNNEGKWISGKAVRIQGMGIKFVENYIIYDINDNPINTIPICPSTSIGLTT